MWYNKEVFSCQTKQKVNKVNFDANRQEIKRSLAGRARIYNRAH